jgi:hypothetical protein
MIRGLQNSIRIRGVVGTLRFFWLRIFNFSGVSPDILSRMFDLGEYDREHNVETVGLIEMDQLEFDSPNKAHGVRYGAVTPWKFQETLELIPVDHRQYTFVDLGSGKGAALLYASDYPFAKIIGVEFAPSLHAVALRNLERFHSKTQKCTDLTAIFQDAATYEFPAGPLILFFNIPFGVPIWKAVAQNFRRAPKGNGRSYWIFLNYGYLPEAADYVAGLDFLKLIYSSENVRLYEDRG